MLSTSYYGFQAKPREFDPSRHGRDLEKLVCGISSARVFNNHGGVLPERLSFQQSVSDCLDHQPAEVVANDKRGRPIGLKPWDPFQPPTGHGGRIRYWVMRRLPKSFQTRVGLYVALGRSLDQWHGVDLVLVCWPALVGRTRRRVTIDLATFEKVHCKADLQLDLAKLDKEMAVIGCDIALYFKEKISRAELARRLQSWAVKRDRD